MAKKKKSREELLIEKKLRERERYKKIIEDPVKKELQKQKKEKNTKIRRKKTSQACERHESQGATTETKNVENKLQCLL